VTDYITLDQLKATLNIAGGATDGDLQTAISSASQSIDQDTNRRFWADADASQVRKYVPNNQGFCIIDDLAEFTSLYYQADVWVQDQDFFFEPLNAAADGFPFTAIRTLAKPFIYTLADQPAGWASFDGRITLTGKFGWPGDVPVPIQQATTILAAKLFKRPRDAAFSTLGVGLDGAIVRTGSYDAEYEALVSPFRRRTWFG
jgi:Phage gp6-like head-tail connector protein